MASKIEAAASPFGIPAHVPLGLQLVDHFGIELEDGGDDAGDGDDGDDDGSGPTHMDPGPKVVAMDAAPTPPPESS